MAVVAERAERVVDNQIALAEPVGDADQIDQQIVGRDFAQLQRAEHDVHVAAALLIAGTAGFADNVVDVAIPQIGRASCRERVCQSVYISVVAVSLKKKKKKKNN